MTWAKLCDNFDSHPKISAAWEVSPAAVGLHACALAYCARHLTDGEVHPAFVAQRFRSPRARDQAVEALVSCGLWIPAVHGWRIHDYLAYNPSRDAVMAEREAQRERKRKQRGPPPARSLVPGGVPGESRGDSRSESRARAARAVDVDVKDPSLTTELPTAELHASATDEAERILARCPNLSTNREALENAVAMYPSVGPVDAARLAAMWASDPGWKTTSGAAAYRAAARKLDAERQAPSQAARNGSRPGTPPMGMSGEEYGRRMESKGLRSVQERLAAMTVGEREEFERCVAASREAM